MAATSTPTIKSLIKLLCQDFPEINFTEAAMFYWNGTQKTVYFVPGNDIGQLFHELAHGVLQHTTYHRDIELIAMEREAWTKAIEIAKNYGLVIQEEIIENHMESYRDWLHARSTCPECNENGIQTSSDTYRCISCTAKWRINDARQCGLKRYTLKNSAPN